MPLQKCLQRFHTLEPIDVPIQLIHEDEQHACGREHHVRANFRTLAEYSHLRCCAILQHAHQVEAQQQ